MSPPIIAAIIGRQMVVQSIAVSVPKPYSLSDDAVLVTRAQTEDMAAMEALILRHQATIFNLTLLMVWRRESAEDATQEKPHLGRRLLEPALDRPRLLAEIARDPLAPGCAAMNGPCH